MKTMYRLFFLFVAMIGLFSACTDVDQRQMPTLKSQDTNNVGRFTADFEGIPSTKMVRALSILNPESKTMQYDLNTYTLPSEAKILSTDPLYKSDLGGDQYKIYLYAVCNDGANTYTSGLVEGVAKLIKDNGKVQIRVSAKFDLNNNGTPLTDIEGKTVTLTGIIGGAKIPGGTKVFISGVSNNLTTDRINKTDNKEFMPPVILVKKDVVAHGNSLSFSDGSFQLYGALLGFNIKNNFSGSIATSKFRIKTNAYSMSGALDLSQYDKDGKLIHLASDSYNNLESYNGTALASGVDKRNVRDLELVTNTFTEDNITASSPENFAYISYGISNISLNKGNSSNIVYTWGMPNSYPVNSSGLYVEDNINNVCNEIYGSVTTSEGSTPFTLINKQQFKTATTAAGTATSNKALDPALKNNSSSVMSITLGGTAEDDNTADLMFRRVYLGNFKYGLTSGDNQSYKNMNYTNVYDKQMNMIEIYNPTNHPCDMTRYFLMSYSDYEDGNFLYKTIHGSDAVSDLKVLGDALMAPLSPKSWNTSSSKDPRIVTTLGVQEDCPIFREASVKFYSAELSGKTLGNGLERVDDPNYQRYAAITFFSRNGDKNVITNKDQTLAKLDSIKTLAGGHSIVYMGPGVWMWMKYHNTYYCNKNEGDFYPFTDDQNKIEPGGDWNSFLNNQNTTTYVAINDAFSNRSQDIITNANKNYDYSSHFWGSEPDYERAQIRAGWPSLPTYVPNHKGEKDYWWFRSRYDSNVNPKPVWKPGIFGIAAAQGLILVKMEKKTFVSNSAEGLITKDRWVPVIIDVTPLAKDKDRGDYAIYTLSQDYYGPYYQFRAKKNDFQPYFYRQWLVKNKPKFYPSPDVNNQNGTWTITNDRSIGGKFGDKNW